MNQGAGLHAGPPSPPPLPLPTLTEGSRCSRLVTAEVMATGSLLLSASSQDEKEVKLLQERKIDFSTSAKILKDSKTGSLGWLWGEGCPQALPAGLQQTPPQPLPLTAGNQGATSVCREVNNPSWHPGNKSGFGPPGCGLRALPGNQDRGIRG